MRQKHLTKNAGTYNSPSFRRTEKACSCTWLILFRCKTLEVMRTRQTLKPVLRADVIIYSSCNSNAGERVRFSSVAWKSGQKPNSLNSEQSAFAAEWIMQMCTYRTVSMAHERNETFPTDSMRFPSKSLQEQRAHTHTQNKFIRRHGLFNSKTASDFTDVRLTASSIGASLDRCHPALSKSCSAKPCQSEKTPFFFFYDGVQRQITVCPQSTATKRALTQQKYSKEYVGTHRRTREFSPEKVKEDIWWMLLFSRILHQKKKDKKFESNLQSWSSGNRISPSSPLCLRQFFSQNQISSYIK